MSTKYQGPGAKGKTTIYLVKLDTLLLDFLQRIIAPYENNRAGIVPGGLNKKRVQDIADDYVSTAVGAFHLSDNQDGTYMSLDAHHRFASLVAMNEEQTLTQEIRDQVVPVVVVHESDALVTYQHLNNAKGHTGSEKALNPDFLVGSYIKEWEKKSETKIERGCIAMSLIDIALTREETCSFTVEDTWSKRTKTTELLDKAKDRRNFSFSEGTSSAVVNAIKVHHVIKRTVEEADDAKKQAIKAVNNPGFFQAVMADYLSNGKALGGFTRGNLKKVAKKINSNPELILNYCMTISRRNRKLLKDDKLATLLAA